MASQARFVAIRRVLEQHGWKLRISPFHHIFSKEGEQLLSLTVHHGRIARVYVRRVEKALGFKVR